MGMLALQDASVLLAKAGKLERVVGRACDEGPETEVLNVVHEAILFAERPHICQNLLLRAPGKWVLKLGGKVFHSRRLSTAMFIAVDLREVIAGSLFWLHDWKSSPVPGDSDM